MDFFETLSNPWPWWISGPAIAAVMVTLIYFGTRFGVSSTLETMCTILGAGKHVEYFRVDWKKSAWNLLFIGGAVLGGWISTHLLVGSKPLDLAVGTIHDLNKLGISFDGHTAPAQLFNFQFAFTPRGFLMFVGGGMLIGFGTRYASGCTSGHAISGLSNLQLPSLIAVVGFFLGGLVTTHFILPLIF